MIMQGALMASGGVAEIEFIGNVNTSGVYGSTSVSLPVGTEVGDYIVVAIMRAGSNPSTSSGGAAYLSFLSGVASGIGSDDAEVDVFGGICTNTANITPNQGAYSVLATISISTFRNAGFKSQATSTSYTSRPTLTATAGDAAIYAAAFYDNDAPVFTSITAPTDFTLLTSDEAQYAYYNEDFGGGSAYRLGLPAGSLTPGQFGGLASIDRSAHSLILLESA